MKLSEIKKYLAIVETVSFKLPTGACIPEHFHITEVGLVTKHFIDCGGTERLERVVNFQLWDANDYEHRLKPQKLAHIIALSENKLNIADLEIEVEYQSDTIGKYGLHFNGKEFLLVPKQTACLAKEQCGTPTVSPPVDQVKQELSSCTAGNGCC